MPQLKNILIVPLDWGLGHATRSIPLITNLLEKNCLVLIAGEGSVKALLQAEFPAVQFLTLKGYRIRYSKQKGWLRFKIICQIPGILFSVYREHQWLKMVVKQHTIDAVISDNRFGLYHSRIPSIYLTHQLLIKTGNRITENILRKCHQWFIKKYTQCWVPDFEGPDNIAGALSHPGNLLSNTKYIGCLSRFEKNYNGQYVYDIIILLSGPEPQRTLFEKELLFQLKEFTGKVLFIRGLPQEVKEFSSEGLNANIEIKNHLKGTRLSTAIQQSALIICRSGYTTIMDLIKLQKKAILVPTPGQTEQEYLGEYLMQKKLFLCVQQQGFLLSNALGKASGFCFSNKEYRMEEFKNTISLLIENG